jgi:hypothetical protein
MQVSRGLALIYIDHPIVYLGYKTIFRSPGTNPGTPTSWVGVWGEIPLYVQLQVSICLDLLFVNTTDIKEANRDLVGPVLCGF